MKRFTKFSLFLVGLLLMGIASVNAADVLLRFNSKPTSGTTSYTYSTGDKIHAGTITTSFSGNDLSNTCFASPANVRIQVKDIIIELVSTSASSIIVEGMSSTVSDRGIKSISVSDTKTGTYTPITAIKTGLIYGQASCSSTTVSGFSIPQGKFVRLVFNTNGDADGGEQNVNISGFTIIPAATVPVINLLSGDDNQSVMQSKAISDIVYLYGGTADNAIFEWTGDVPTGTIDGVVDASAKTLTISGTADAAAAVGEYPYKVTPKVGETVGTALTGKITVTLETPTSGNNHAINKEIKSVKYYTLLGTEAPKSTAGTLIVITIYKDGSIEKSMTIK